MGLITFPGPKPHVTCGWEMSRTTDSSTSIGRMSKMSAFRRKAVSAGAFWLHNPRMRTQCSLLLIVGLSLAITAHNKTIPDSTPRTYRFSVTYNMANPVGEIVHRDRLTGDYTRGLPDQQVIWKNVQQASADGPSGAFGTPQKRDFMEGFGYRNVMADTMKPDFFKGFPATAVFERNLVWDTSMIEHFGQDFLDRLPLNQAYPLASDQDVKMPDVGTFHNQHIVLELIGHSERNGQHCALIRYQAFFNPLKIINAGMDMKGRSDYWGEIWVSLSTKQVEYATLYENVLGEMTIAGQGTPQPVSVFRAGMLEPVGK